MSLCSGLVIGYSLATWKRKKYLQYLHFFLAFPSLLLFPKRIKLIPESAITTSGQGDISGSIFRHWYLLSFFLTPVDQPFPLIAKAFTPPCWSRHFCKVESWKQPHWLSILEDVVRWSWTYKCFDMVWCLIWGLHLFDDSLCAFRLADFGSWCPTTCGGWRE